MASDEQERAILDAAAEKLGLRLIDVRKRERPDFEVDLEDGRTVGIEVTEARSSKAASGKAKVTRLCQQVRQALEKEGINVLMSIRVTEGELSLIHQDPTRFKKNVDGLVEIGKAYVRGGWTELRPHTRAHLGRCGVEFVEYVAILPVVDGPYCTWSIPGHGDGRSLIQESITRKNAKIADYRAGVGDGREVWLLVVASLGVGGAVDIHEAEGTFVSDFDQTLFLEAYEGLCRILTTVRCDA